MKKLITLFFAAALVTAASAQSGDRYRNDSRNDNSYQSSPYSNNDQYSYQDQYPNNDHYKNSQLYDLNEHDRYYRDRQRLARQRYEYEMMMRKRQAQYHQRMYDNYPYGVTRKPSLQIRIGIGGHRY